MQQNMLLCKLMVMCSMWERELDAVGGAHRLDADRDTRGKEHMGSHRCRGTERGNVGDHISFCSSAEGSLLSTGIST